MEPPPKKKKKIIYISGKNFRWSKIEKFLIFQEKELSSFKVKKLMFQKELTKSGNQKFPTFSLRNKKNFLD